jgi:hypothetical protein
MLQLGLRFATASVLLLASSCVGAVEERAVGAAGPSGEVGSPAAVRWDAFTVNLRNLCDEPRSFSIAGSRDGGEQVLAPGQAVELPMRAGETVVSRTAHGGKLAGWVHTDGGHIWFGSDCRSISTSDDPSTDPVAFERTHGFPPRHLPR